MRGMHRSHKSFFAPSIVLALLASFSFSGCALQNRQVLDENSTNKLTRESKVIAPDKVSSRIWFLKEQNGNLVSVPVERNIDERDPIKNSVVQLLAGPTKEEARAGLKSEVPVGTVLIDVTSEGNLVEINLSKRFAGGGLDSIEARLDQLEHTIKDSAGDKKVYLNVEGKRLLTAGEGLEVKQPLN
jgi:spore germination protein GerM